MLRIEACRDWKALYDYQRELRVPWQFCAPFEQWRDSMLEDVDGQGRALWRDLTTKVAYQGEALVGFLQYGHTALGFAETGEISCEISYPVIRMLYFQVDQPDAGSALLADALEQLGNQPRIYAFFHYFGLSCQGRHGKLFEQHRHVEDLLRRSGFVTEHENVYYSAAVQAVDADVALAWDPVTAGAQQSGTFLVQGAPVGCCEIHIVRDGALAYLRWIYIQDPLQNQGLGTRCMNALRSDLYARGFPRLDTDTAADNLRAQHYYEKNGFLRRGLTRSYYRDRR